jgi:acetylornithine deacetylase/succinyl-diaminopimelate desuccinylase-like protein
MRKLRTSARGLSSPRRGVGTLAVFAAALVAVSSVSVPVFGMPGLVVARQADVAASQAIAREIFEELIEIPTVADADRTVEAAEAMAARLITAGFSPEDVQVVGPEPQLGSLVARYRGTGEGGGPILLMAHIDVVPALREDWSFEPFVFREEGGYFYGRGTTDNKAGAAHLVANFIRLKQEGFVPDRDLIIVLSADEESTGASVTWLVNERRDLVDAEFALNTDAGGGVLKDGKPHIFTVQASEKVYLTFQLEVKNAGGHSSIPVDDNAIYRLTMGLARLSEFAFPIESNEITRTYFARYSQFEEGETAELMQATADGEMSAAARLATMEPYWNAMLRTTCVATRLAAGHADNALPQTAQAVVNCRILPGKSPDDVEAELRRVLGDEEVALTRLNEPTASPPSPLTPGVMGTLETLVEELFPGAPVIPTMSTGATDGLYVRNGGIPVYGVSAMLEDEDEEVRAHGRDERLSTRAFYDALEFWYRMLKEFSS